MNLTLYLTADCGAHQSQIKIQSSFPWLYKVSPTQNYFFLNDMHAKKPRSQTSNFILWPGASLPGRRGAQAQAWNLCSNPDGDIIATTFCELNFLGGRCFCQGGSFATRHRVTVSWGVAHNHPFPPLRRKGLGWLGKATPGQAGPGRARKGPSQAWRSALTRWNKMIQTLWWNLLSIRRGLLGTVHVIEQQPLHWTLTP